MCSGRPVLRVADPAPTANYRGYVPQLNLNNAGEYYENYYTQPQEISAVQWLNTASCRCDIVQADPFASARFLPYASFQIDANNYPTAVYRTSYVIMGADTVNSGTSTAAPTATS